MLFGNVALLTEVNAVPFWVSLHILHQKAGRISYKFVYICLSFCNSDGPLADFPAVFFHICHGTQQAVVTPYRAYQNV